LLPLIILSDCDSDDYRQAKKIRLSTYDADSDDPSIANRGDGRPFFGASQFPSLDQQTHSIPLDPGMHQVPLIATSGHVTKEAHHVAQAETTSRPVINVEML
jgi:hypothetical protein